MKKLALILVLMAILSNLGLAQAIENLESPDSAVRQEGEPPVAPIAVDFGVVGGYRYMRVTGENVPVHAFPSERGRILYYFEGGYDFVTPRSQEGDWVQINPGEWVEAENLVEVYPSYFTGSIIQAEPTTPWGWILISHYASAEPGGAEVKEDAYYVKRYQTTYFYNAVADAEGWVWYDVGGNRWVKQTLVSKVNHVANPGVSGRWVAVDLYEQNLVAYEGNTMVFATLVATGLPGSDTNTGLFQIYASSINNPMSGRENGYGDYRLENVPYAMYFDNSISLHGTYWHNRFGYRQSRGCVNLTISDAHWLYEWLGEGAHVYVYYSQPY